MKKYGIIEKIKIWGERTPGMSWCQHCGKTWDRVDYKPIQYNVKMPDTGSGMFPICSSCFDELSPEEIFEYCKKLGDEWKKKDIDLDIDFDVIRYNVDYLKNCYKCGEI